MCGKGQNTTTNQTTTSANPQAAAAYSNLLNQASSVASTPYQAYTGELTAPVNAQQTAGINGINAGANLAQPAVNQAIGIAGNAANPLTQQQIQNYQNPYTQNVVDATQNQFNLNNAQQQAALKGNTISSGALGGNREGVAQANLSTQQAAAQNPIIAGLYSNSYNQGLATAAQQYQQNPLAAAGSLANFGISGQGAALSGAGAQLGAGTVQQQTQQAADTANYGQYAQAQAYPYQQTQWLAGVDTGVGSQLGGSSSGQTTGPAPNQTAQYLGVGIAGAGLLSDRRAKEGIEHVGKMNDGTPIYRFRYKGSPEWHVGPMAQDVEKSNPDAVSRGVDGYRYLDLKEATDDSVRRASGGGVSGTPWGDAQGWIPQVSGIHGGAGAPHGGAPSLTQTPAFDATKFASGLTGLGKSSSLGGLDWKGLGNSGGTLSGDAWGGGSFASGDAYGGSSDNPAPGMTAADYGEGFARGGVAGYAEGGAPDDVFGDENRRLGYEMLRRREGIQAPDVIPGGEPAPSRGVAPVWNPDEPYRMPDQAAVDAWRSGNPVPSLGTPPVAAAGDDEGLPPEVTKGVSRPPVAPEDDGETAMAYAPTPSAGVAPAAQPPAPQEEPRGGLGLLPISPNASSGLLAAGLGMLASRSPFLGNAVGEGGLAGLSAYGAANEHDRKVAEEAAKLSREAKQHAEEMALKTATQKETGRHNRATEENASDKAPTGYQKTKDGTLAFIKGGPHDPDQISAETSARTKKGTELDDDTVDAIAQRVAQGDTRAVIGLGRNPAGIAQIQKRVAEIFKEQGLDHEQGAKAILGNIADQAGRMTAERTQAGIAAKLAVYGRNVDNAIGVAERASEEASRTSFVPANKAINAFKSNTGDPKVVALGQALTTLTNEYARAVGGGHGTVHDKEQAEQHLNQAQSHEQLKAIMAVMRKEVEMTKKSMPEAREEMRELYSRPSSEKLKPAAGVASPASGFTPPAGALPGKPDANGKVWYYDPNKKGPDGRPLPYPGQ